MLLRRILTVAGVLLAFAEPAHPAAPADSLHPSSSWLGLLPDGLEKRRYILDCTGCHQFNETRVFSEGKPRTKARWEEDTARMLSFAGASSGFPVIANGRDPLKSAEWLTTHLGTAPKPAARGDFRLSSDGNIREYDLPVAPDLPHDVAIDASGKAIITGMFTHVMYKLDPETGTVTNVPIPVDKANPRAIDIDRDGNWWVLLGNPKKVARYNPAADAWKTFDIGMYPHSVAVSQDGASVWFNGHFSRDPELIGRIDVAKGAVDTFVVPIHPTMGKEPGGPVPYEQRIAPDGKIWISELQGNRIVSFEPSTGGFEAFTLPTAWSGPRRFDIAPDGVLWIPAYAANRLVRFDPATKKFREFDLPIRDSVPYIARVDAGTGMIWIGTAAADVLYRFDPNTETFAAWGLPTRGATVRHMTIDPRNHDVWLAYGASPAIHPARVARFRLTE